ncbi:histidine kinase CKI1-like isoform X2 [Solanum dulcamara]|uniref:histidine kinase CKI1-like isoform X2 n=1 Tax=Solanum dulcamara TaxID=45834 RepID=UPI00248532B4|nr:histidine kinase CKI1-like isoform X2 [Solanum dulcamara]
MARDSCLARVTAGVAVGGAIGGAVAMNPSLFKMPMPVGFCLVLSLIMLLVPAVLIPFWINKVKIIEGKIKVYNVQDFVQRDYHKNIKFGFMLIILMMVALAISIVTFVILTIRAARREMYLCSALIKQMEATQQAERKSMNKSTASARANHDVRASLAGISGLIWMCRIQASPESEFVKYLDHMESCKNDLLDILNSILDESKIEEGKKQLKEEEFNIEELLEHVVNIYYPNGAMKNVDVLLDPCDGSIKRFSRVKGDRIELQRILNNLLQNADKFTSEGHITLRAWARKPGFEESFNLAPNTSISSIGCMSCLRLQNDESSKEMRVLNRVQKDPNCVEYIFEVDDTGKGIPKEKQKSVFENYVQVNDQTTSVHGSQAGTGLGLSITQSLVRLMGGEIGIVDKQIGEKGTCFRFNIFLIACDQPQAQDHQAISVNYARKEDLESQLGGGYISSDSYYHSVASDNSITSHQKSNVILFIKEEERSRVLRRFMMNILGLNVHVVNRQEQFPLTLKKVKGKIINFPSYNSSSSSGESKEIPLSALDGKDINTSSFQRRGRGLRSKSAVIRFILIIIDTSDGLTRDMSRAMAEFRKDFTKNVSLRVVWLDKPGVDEDKLPSTDIVMAKPLHGSRLYRVLKFTQQIKDETTSRIKIQQHPLVQDVSVEVNGHSNKKLPLTGKKILVVEDDRTLLMICTTAISKLGATTYTCKNGQEAVDEVCKGLSDQRDIGPSTPSPPFDYILMDCEMPEMNGFEATKGIRKEEARYGIRIPIIAFTAHTEKEETDKIFQAGMDYYLPKESNGEEILKAIDYIEHTMV